MYPEKWAFPMDCPDCRAASAYPYEASTIRGKATTVRLGLRCRECKYEWRMELDSDPLPADREPND